MKTSFVIALFSASMAFASVIPKTIKVLDSPLEGYDVAPLKWTGKVNKRGKDVTLDGTLEEITAKARQVNPDFGFSKPEKRAGLGRINCGWGGSGDAGSVAIREGVEYLESFGEGYCGLDDGPYKCARISCSYNSAIWLCNDQDTPLRVKCKDLAPFIHKIRDDCYTPGFGEPLTRGQIFSDDEKWNVIVGKDSC
ncbi:hypothetical protein ACJZ2D_014038 [Fusarium nematophilum]